MSEQEKKIVPKLRFPEFLDTAQWTITTLSKLADRVTLRNKNATVIRVFTNSAVDGVVDQRDYFDKDIANQNNLENYFIVDEGCYVYNPRISNTAPVGPISKNKIGKGVMSPLYTVFKFHSAENDFYEHFFKTENWYSYLRNISNSGARHDRMSITNDAFMEMPLPQTNSKEQQKIADCLSSLDDLITAQNQKVEALNQHKKGLMQQLFPAEGETVPRLRFPEFSQLWQKSPLGTLCSSISSGRDQLDIDGRYDLYGSTSKIGKTINPSFQGERILVARVGANAGFLTKAKGVFGVTDNTLVISLNAAIDIDYLYYYLGTVNINKLIFGSGQPLITGSILKALDIPLPIESEQKKISACLLSLDEDIAGQRSKLESLMTLKKGLMQQLFPDLERVVV